jgi:hypothetical protein
MWTSRSAPPAVSAAGSPYPLTPLQHGMLFQALRAPGAGVDVEQAVGRLHEAVDAGRLRAAWERVVRRHGVLRTRYRWADVPEPVQLEVPEADVPFAVHDCSGLPAPEREAHLQGWLADDRARGFDLGRGPVMRLALFRFGAQEHVLVWSFHHAILGGGSVAAVLTEVFALYDGAAEADLPVRRPFRDHVAWLVARDPADDQAYWTRRLRDLDPPPPMPSVRRAPRDPGTEPRYGELEIRLSPGAEAALRRFKQERGVNLNTVAQGAWALLLGRYTGHPEAVFGLVRGGRATGLEGADGILGLSINTVPVRVPLPAGTPALDWLRALAADNAELRRHEHAGLADISRWCGLRAGASLFDSTFNYHTEFFEDAFRGLGGRWEHRAFRMLRRTGFPLSVAVASAAPLRVQLDYDADLFDAEAAARLLGHFARLMEALATEPETPLDRLPMTGAEERDALLRTGRATAAFSPAERIEQRFARVAPARASSSP